MAFQIPIWLDDRFSQQWPESRPEQAGLRAVVGTLLWCLYGVLAEKSLDLVVSP